MQDYIKHLQSQIEYWQRIALAEREKNIKLEEIIKKIEEKILSNVLIFITFILKNQLLPLSVIL